MLIEIAIGDAYGAGFEFVKPVFTEKNHKMEKYIGHAFDEIEPGQYTDDTQMTIAISELMLEHENWTPTLIADYFVKTYKRNPIDGYAKGFQGVLDEVKGGDELIERIESFSADFGPSNKNGAAMRSVPLGLISSKEELLKKAEMQARITHASEDGIYSSKAIALASYFFVNKLGKKSELKEFLVSELTMPIDSNKTTRCACDAIDTVDAVITVLLASESLSQIIDKAVLMGGDTDSVASIACGIASFSDEYARDLPSFLYDDFIGGAEGKYGMEYLSDLEKRLTNKFL